MFKTRYMHKEVTQLVNDMPSVCEPQLVPSLMDYIVNYQGNNYYDGYDLEDLSDDVEVIEDFTDFGKNVNAIERNEVKRNEVNVSTEEVNTDNETKPDSDATMSVSESN